MTKDHGGLNRGTQRQTRQRQRQKETESTARGDSGGFPVICFLADQEPLGGGTEGPRQRLGAGSAMPLAALGSPPSGVPGVTLAQEGAMGHNRSRLQL